MIVFDGVSLESAAPVRVEDIRVSPIQYNPIARPRAIRWGSEFVRMNGGTRTVTITFAIQEMNRTLRHQYLMALSAWAKTDKEYFLELPEDPVRGLFCVCTGKPEPSARQWWEAKLRLVFTCFNNPYWTSKATKSVECGTQFNVLGDAPPIMRIERTVSAAVYSQAYGLDSNQMGFTTIPAGEMVIDLNNETAAVDGVSIMQYYAPSGTFLVPRTGIQAVIGTGTVKYKERWE